MDFRCKTRKREERKPKYEQLELTYPHNVLLYRLPPTEDIKMQEFEELALERLQVLRILHQAHAKALRLCSEDWKEYVNTELTREGLKGYLRLCSSGTSSAHVSESKREAELQARRRDYISHFILRLAYCRTEDLRRWFVAREMELFKYKFAALSGADVKHFLELNKLSYVPLTDEQKSDVKEGLYDSTMGQSVSRIELLDFYKVRFTQVPDLVRSRRCFLKAGYAYVNSHDFVSIMAIEQAKEIEHGLTAALRIIGDVENDERLVHLLRSLHTSYAGKDYAVSKVDAVPIESLDQLSKKSYPLCMRMCHEHIREQHHIKHIGRMQYGLFLKGIGVTLEDAIRFFRDEFTKKMDPDKFAKSYEYNIQHNYGKKGSMLNYSPYSCLKIIQENPGISEVNGCPFKLYDQPMLKSKLNANGLSSAHVQEVAAYAAKGHYQLACGKYFQITHDAATEVGITHPNQYYEESQTVMGSRADKKGSSAAPQRKLKHSGNGVSQVMTIDDDDELWRLAETEETAYYSQQAEKNAWEEELDLTSVNC